VRKRHDVLVIGAGQAGLATGYWLRQSGLRFVLVDGAARVGDSWRSRWDSLTLFTPARYSALPGRAVPGDPDRFPTRDEIADYLEAYAVDFELPVQLGEAVARLERRDGIFVARLSSGRSLTAHSVVVATGAFQVPAVPGIARGLGAGVAQLTPNSYRNPAALPGGSVLIVGDGATGRQIAAELAGTHRVLLATGRPRHISPERLLGRSVFWWLDRLRLLRSHRDSLPGRLLRRRDPFPGRHLGLDSLRGEGVVTRPRVAALAQDRVTFTDGSEETISAIIWATGYRDDTSWIAVHGALDERAQIAQREGVSPVQGLYYVGRNWQRNRGSALLLGVGQDARLIVERIARHAGEGLSARPIGVVSVA
jgi:putative flavoprotein involved in K+ transport